MITPTAHHGLMSPDSETASQRALREKRESFASVISRSMQAKPAEQQARDAATGLVARALVQPMLSQLRQNSGASPMFAPSSAERSMREIWDAQVALRITETSRWPLIDGVARSITRNGMSLQDGVEA